MSFSSTKANGNVRFYSEKHLADLDYKGLFPEHNTDNLHYGHVAKNIHVYSGENQFYMFAKTPQGYVYLGEGQCKPEDIGLPTISKKFTQNLFFTQLAFGLWYKLYVEIPPSTLINIKDITDYLIEYFDIFQMVMADEEEAGLEASDSEPNFDMSKYVQTKSGNSLSANALPYTITLPYHNKEITITKEMVVIEALS